MTDLNRDESETQPLAIPILGNNGDYTAPGKDWDASPVRAPLSDGSEEAGMYPNTDLPAEVFNDLLGRLGWGLASIVDASAVAWPGGKAANTGQPNDNSVGTRALISVGPFWYYGGVYQELLLQFNTAKLFYSYDGREWIDAGAHGLSGTPTGFAVGHSVISAVDYVSILGWDNTASGTMRISHNVGSSWANAGTLPASFSPGASVGGFHNPDHTGVGRFFVCGPSQLYYSDHDDVSGEWTRITTSSLGWTGAPAPGPNCFATSPTRCAIGINGAPSVIHSADGDTWAAAPFSTAPEDGVMALHWSASHQLWIALSASNGRILTAPASMGSWTERAQITDNNGSAVTSLVDVCSLGRTIVVSAGGRLWATRNFLSWRCIPGLVPTNDGVNPTSWTWLRSFGGGLWAGRKRQISGNASLEYARSAVLPAELIRKGGSY